MQTHRGRRVDTSLLSPFALAFRAARKAANLTQQEVADRIPIARGAISQTENHRGGAHSLSEANARQAANVMRTDVDALIRLRGPAKPRSQPKPAPRSWRATVRAMVPENPLPYTVFESDEECNLRYRTRWAIGAPPSFASEPARAEVHRDIDILLRGKR